MTALTEPGLELEAYQSELWWMKAADFNQRELVVELGEEFGPGGPLVIDELNAQAKREKKGGHVRTGWRSLARRCFLPGGADEARRIVEHAAEIGALDDYEAEDDGRRFTCRVSGFSTDQKSAKAAERQARSRAKKAAAAAPTDDTDGGVTVRDGASPERDGALPREEESREEGEEKNVKNNGNSLSNQGEEGSETASTSLLDENEAKRVARDRRPVKFRGNPVPAVLVERGERLLEVFNDAAGRRLSPRAGDGNASESLKQIVGALLERPHEPEDVWAAGVRAAITDPPDWAGGRPLAVGDLFGQRSSEHTLNRGRGDRPVQRRSSGRATPADFQALKQVAA